MSAQLYLAATGGAIILIAAVAKAKTRLDLSRAKHPSPSPVMPAWRAESPRWSRSTNTTNGSSFAPTMRPTGRRTRRDGFMRLSTLFRERFAKTSARTAEAAASISDLQFISAYRVPFQYSRFVRQHLSAGSFLESSSGVTVTDLDGNVLYDLTGSYGVNLFGYDFYKDCIAQGAERVRDLGPVLGAYHPIVAYNVRAAARNLRSRRSLLPHVRHRGGDASGSSGPLSHAAALTSFVSAAPTTAGGATCSRASEIRRRRATPTRWTRCPSARCGSAPRRDIACVLVNPLQALHPNARRTGGFLSGR